MATFIVFITSLVLLGLLFLMKSWEINRGRKIFLENLFLKCDDLIYKFILKIRYWWSHISFKNTRLVFTWIVLRGHKSIIAIKRRFDHEQSHFFTKREDPSFIKNKGSASFFLKNVSEYKKTLREKKGE
jgi:hypothetical protein